MKTVNIITADNIFHYPTYIVSVFLFCWIEYQLPVIGKHSCGILNRNMV